MSEEAIETPISPESRTQRLAASAEKRRKWLRRAANLVIIGGVLLLAYPISTWGYTWFQQRGLRGQLEESAPQVTLPVEALQTVDFTPATAPSATATASAGSAPAAPDPAAQAAAPAEAARLAQLAAFKAAADKFDSEVNATGTPLGRVVIPSIGVDVVMVEGTGKGDIREGPGRRPDTPFPGQGGNFVVSGHRTTYGAPFRKLNNVKVGDEIFLILPYGVARYLVTRTVIVNPKDVGAVAQIGSEQVSLAACHPLTSARQRIVVQGDLVGFSLSGPAQGSTQP